MRVPYAGLWAVIYSVITRVLIARAQVRPEQHTLISVFKLNSCKLFQFKHLRARLIIMHANPRSERAQILSSLWSIVWMDKFTQKLSKCRLDKYPIADIAGWTYSISALDRCTLLKWQRFLNINQTATTKKSLTALDWIAFVTLIKINL